MQLGNNRSGFCPSKRIKNSTPGLVQAGKQPVNQRSREFGSGTSNLSTKENVADLRAVRIACGP